MNPLTAMLMLSDAQRFGYPSIAVTAGYSALGKMLVVRISASSSEIFLPAVVAAIQRARHFDCSTDAAC